jgi:small subunit ribosomal protein S10
MAATKKAESATKKAVADSSKPKIRIIIRAFDHRVIDEATKTIVDTAQRSGAIISGPIPLPTRIQRITVNRSTFKHKDARDQFEMRTHKRLIDITESTSNTVSSLQTLTLPSGVDVEIKMA